MKAFLIFLLIAVMLTAAGLYRAHAGIERFIEEELRQDNPIVQAALLSRTRLRKNLKKGGLMEITVSDVYLAFKEKELREKALPDEKVKVFMGCPTLVKKSAIEVLIGRVRVLGRGVDDSRTL